MHFKLNNSQSLIAFLTFICSFALSIGYTASVGAQDTSVWNTDVNDVYFDAGKVGIGNTDPQTDLHISGSASPEIVRLQKDDNYLSVTANRDNTDKLEIASFKVDQGPRELLLNRQGGNVGIGINDPSYTLDVNGYIASRYTFTAIDTRPSGYPLYRVGNDGYLTDVDQANTVGIHGSQDPSQGKLQLGSGGATIEGFSNGDMCIGSC